MKLTIKEREMENRRLDEARDLLLREAAPLVLTEYTTVILKTAAKRLEREQETIKNRLAGRSLKATGKSAKLIRYEQQTAFLKSVISRWKNNQIGVLELSADDSAQLRVVIGELLDRRKKYRENTQAATERQSELIAAGEGEHLIQARAENARRAAEVHKAMPELSELNRQAGLKGGLSRMSQLDAEERKEFSQKGVEAKRRKNKIKKKS